MAKVRYCCSPSIVEHVVRVFYKMLLKNHSWYIKASPSTYTMQLQKPNLSLHIERLLPDVATGVVPLVPLSSQQFQSYDVTIRKKQKGFKKAGTPNGFASLRWKCRYTDGSHLSKSHWVFLQTQLRATLRVLNASLLRKHLRNLQSVEKSAKDSDRVTKHSCEDAGVKTIYYRRLVMLS